MNIENKLREFLLQDKSIISNIILSTKTDKLDYVKIYDDGISFLPLEKLEPESDGWSSKGRVKVKPGKFINKIVDKTILSEVMNTHDIENWVNRFKSHFMDGGDIKIIAGEDINYAYNSDNYSGERRGTLWSCMSGTECQERLSIYSSNPETIQLVAQYDKDNKIKSRALLWTLSNGNKMMDRIYYSEDQSQNTYKRLCEENGWLHRDNIDDTVLCYIKNWEQKQYPYLDTMRFIHKDDKGYYITNSHELEGDYIIPNGTDGYHIANHVRIGNKWVHNTKAAICGVTGLGMLIEDMIEVPRYNRIDKNEASQDKWGNWFYKNDLVESILQGGLLPKRASYQLKESGDWIGRKLYRKNVENGTWIDGSAIYKEKTIWVLPENIEIQEQADLLEKEELKEKISLLNNRYTKESMGEFSLSKIKNIYKSLTNDRDLVGVNIHNRVIVDDGVQDIFNLEEPE